VPLHARPLWQGFLIFLGPLVLSNVLQALQGTVNAMFLGRLLGVKALASVSSFFPILFVFMSFMIGFGNGATVVLGQAYGAKDHDKVQSVAGTTLGVSLMAGAVIAALGGTFAHTIFTIVGTPPDIIHDTAAYSRVMFVGLPILFVFLMATTLMRGVGDTVTPLWALVVSIIVACVTTPALIQGWGGLPRMGVASAAYAGILSWVATLTWMSFYLRRVNHPLAPSKSLLRHFNIDWKILKVVLRIGFPTGVQLVLLSLGEATMLSLVNSFGSNVTAAYGTVNQVANYIQFPAFSISITASILAAQAIGRGDTGTLGGITRTGLRLNWAMTGALVAGGYLLSRSLIELFIDDHEVTELAQHFLHIKLIAYLFFGASGIYAGVMRASGNVIAPTAINLASMLVIQVTTAYILSHWVGAVGIWVAYTVAGVSGYLMQMVYYQLVWRKQRIEKLI
jgi:putative MATE family efflux protein